MKPFHEPPHFAGKKTVVSQDMLSCTNKIIDFTTEEVHTGFIG